MSIPVILLLPTSLATSAMSMSVEDRASSSTLLPGFVLDTNFPMIPVGDATTQVSIASSIGATEGDEARVAVRGFIDASLEDPPQTIGDHVVYADPEIDTFLTCIGDPPVGTFEDVKTELDVQGLWDQGLDGNGVAIAIMDTGINLDHLKTVLGWRPTMDTTNSWTPPGSKFKPGAFPVDHGTMCAFDVLIAAPNATLLDFPILSAKLPGGGSIMSATLSAALLTYSTILLSWNSGVGSGDLSQYKGLVLSNSWGIFHPSWDFPVGHPGRYCDNPNHPFMLQLEAMSRGKIDVFFAAGNCGADCPDGRCQNRTKEAVMGASASIDAMSVAGCDINNERVGYSSQGPSIPGIPPGTKPDITSYTHFMGSQAFGADQPDSGTSAACPVAAGCMAALRTSILPRTPADPYMMYDHLRMSAKVPPGQASGWNGDYGHGIIRPVPVAGLFGPFTV
jgi:subtilisin family serine protease